MGMMKLLVSILLMAVVLAGCGEVRNDPPRVRDARDMITLLGPIGTPFSDRLHKDYAGIVAAIDPVESGADNGGVRRRWIWKGQVIQAESERAVDYDPLKGMDATAIQRITYGIGPVIIPGHGPRMKDGKVVIPATGPKTVDAGFALTDAADISAIVTCLRSKSIQVTRMVARRALKLSDGTSIDTDINEEIVSRTWSGNPGFRIYLKDGKGYVLIQGLLSIGEYADFENAELNRVMRDIAERRGDRPERVFADY